MGQGKPKTVINYADPQEEDALEEPHVQERAATETAVFPVDRRRSKLTTDPEGSSANEPPPVS